MIFVLGLYSSYETEYSRYGWLWEWFEDAQSACMCSCLSRKMDIAIASNKRSAKKVCAIQGEDKLRPSRERGGF